MSDNENPSAIDIAEAERGAAIAWLHRRSNMCRDARRWYRPFRSIYLRHLAAAFRAAALMMKECAHLAPTLEAETVAIRAALARKNGGAS